MPLYNCIEAMRQTGAPGWTRSTPAHKVARMATDRPTLGILLMLGFCVLAPLGDGLAKLATQTMPVVQIVAARFIAQAVILIPLALLAGRDLRMSAGVLWITLVRTLLHVSALAALFVALIYMPLAETLAIVFVQPFLMILLARGVMGEEVGARRLAACGVGFVGTLLVIQPAFAQAGPIALLPLYVAVAFTAFIMLTRRIARAGDPLVLQAMSGAMALPMVLPVLVLGMALDLPAIAPVAPGWSGWWLLLLIGGVGTLAHLLMTWALRFAPSATLAPIQYMELPFTVLIGWLMFRDFPDRLALAGIVVIIGSGLYIVFRERRLSLTPRAVPQARLPVPPRAEGQASPPPKG
ncbi:DMT family transporter [Alkalilacustris brevis]|uniref:DMT family transporter n=1 Tax=Alkalilacustris brevis TaxID=2026338 RepID=UPI003082A65A